MPFQIQSVPYDDNLRRIVEMAKAQLRVSSPFITMAGAKLLENRGLSLQILTKVTGANLASKALDRQALELLIEFGAEVRSIPNLHAKIYLADSRAGLVTSSNLTASGMYKNVEVGLSFVDEEEVFESVNSLFSRLWDRATGVTPEVLHQLAERLDSAKFSGGLWKPKPAARPQNPLVPSPAVGYVVSEVAVQIDGSPSARVESEANDVDEDDSGDLYCRLPSTGSALAVALAGHDERVVQGMLNTIGQTYPAEEIIGDGRASELLGMSRVAFRRSMGRGEYRECGSAGSGRADYAVRHGGPIPRVSSGGHVRSSPRGHGGVYAGEEAGLYATHRRQSASTDR